MNAEWRMKLSSRHDLPTCREAAEKAAARAGFTGNDHGDVVSAVFEACVNALTHGCADGQYPASLNIRVMDDRFEAIVADSGKGMSRLAGKRFPSPRAPRGHGIPLMRAFMDEVKLEHADGCAITLVKYTPQNN